MRKLVIQSVQPRRLILKKYTTDYLQDFLILRHQKKKAKEHTMNIATSKEKSF